MWLDFVRIAWMDIAKQRRMGDVVWGVCDLREGFVGGGLFGDVYVCA